MVEKSTFIQPTFIDNGSVDWQPVKNAFTEIQDILNEHANELKASVRHSTNTISFALDSSEAITVLRAGKHLRGKIINAFVMMGDNIEQETIVELVGITQPIKFSKTEKAGKIRIFNILKEALHFSENVIAKQSSNRRLIITFTLESTEEIS